MFLQCISPLHLPAVRWNVFRKWCMYIHHSVLLFNQLPHHTETPSRMWAVLLGCSLAWIKLSEAWKRERKTCIAEKEREMERETQRCYASACGCLEIDLNTPCSLVVGMYNNTFVCTHTHIHTHTITFWKATYAFTRTPTFELLWDEDFHFTFAWSLEALKWKTNHKSLSVQIYIIIKSSQTQAWIIMFNFLVRKSKLKNIKHMIYAGPDYMRKWELLGSINIQIQLQVH